MNLSVPNFVRTLFGEPLVAQYVPEVYEIVGDKIEEELPEIIDPPSDDSIEPHSVMTIADFNPNKSTQWQREPIVLDNDSKSSTTNIFLALLPKDIPNYLKEAFRLLLEKDETSSFKQ